MEHWLKEYLKFVVLRALTSMISETISDENTWLIIFYPFTAFASSDVHNHTPGTNKHKHGEEDAYKPFLQIKEEGKS